VKSVVLPKPDSFMISTVSYPNMTICAGCDQTYAPRPLSSTESARCRRCGSTLEHGHHLSISIWLALTLTAAIPRIGLTVRKFDVAEGWPITGSSITLAVDWALSNPGHEPSSSLSCQAEVTETSAGTVAAAVAAGQAAVLNLSRALGAAIEASSNGATPIC
jgi:hypothetical protein